MKITAIDIRASLFNSSKTLTLNLKDSNNLNGYVVKDIIGLDADDIFPKYYGDDLSNNNYYDLALNSRDVVFKIGFKPNPALGQSYSSLRDGIYSLISSFRNGQVEIRFRDGNTAKAAVFGFITKINSPNFTKDPEVDLTIKCKNALLKAIDEINHDVSALNLGNEIVTDELSTAPHGFRFGATFIGNVVEFSIQDQDPANWAFEVNMTGSPLTQFQPGDELHFSSEANNRYLYIVRDLEIIHIVDRIVPTSVWPMMFPGQNSFIMSDWADWSYLTYYPTYWGI